MRHIPSVPICEVSDQGNIFIRGIVKRLEKARVRAFEQNYHNKYDTEDTLFTAEDEL